MERRPVGGRKQSLVGLIVDREDGPEIEERRIQLGLGFEERIDESRLPVVRVQDVERREMGKRLQRSPREEGEALGVVGVIGARSTVKIVAIEVAVRANEVD